MIIKATKKPVTIEAIELTSENISEIKEFTGQNCPPYIGNTDAIWLKTLEGGHRASIGDFIIKGVSGEFYPCKPDIFHLTYDIEG